MTSETDAAGTTVAAGIETPPATPRPAAGESGPELSIVTPLDVPGQPRLDLDRALEAILFIADEPQSVVHLAAAVARPVAEVRASIARLRADYDGEGASGEPRTDIAGDAGEARGIRRGFELREVGGGWRFYVRAEYDALVADFVLAQSTTRLSQPALETLAVIAYLGPVSRPEIARIRGVAADSAVAGLVERGLIAEAGRDKEGGAIRYESTPLFDRVFGLAGRDELPSLDDLGGDAEEIRVRLESVAERRGA